MWPAMPVYPGHCSGYVIHNKESVVDRKDDSLAIESLFSPYLALIILMRGIFRQCHTRNIWRETAYGITMTECRLLEEGGRRHFMTRRFDRLADGDKLHVQPLAAMAHAVASWWALPGSVPAIPAVPCVSSCFRFILIPLH